MTFETLEPGEWGPFEELKAAALEILRLQQLLQAVGIDSTDPRVIPRGHLVYQPQAADLERTREHKTVWIEHCNFGAQIDELIAPTVLQIWKAGLKTIHSCQNNPTGFVWLEFASFADAEQFIQISVPAKNENNRMFNTYQRAFREGPIGFWPLSKKLWLYKVMLQDQGDDSRLLPSFTLSIRFPHEDLPLVLERLEQHNLHKLA